MEHSEADGPSRGGGPDTAGDAALDATHCSDATLLRRHPAAPPTAPASHRRGPSRSVQSPARTPRK